MTTCMKCLILLAIIGFVAAQYQIPTFAGGTNYRTEDSARQETVDPEGNVQGQYSYIDPNGKTISVRYTAGKEGFKIIGEHVPEQQVIPTVQPSFYQPQKSYQPSFRNYNQRYPQYQQQDLQGYQSQNVYQEQEYQPKYTQALFSPAVDPYPAATAGQIKMMQDYLEEERMDIEKEKQMRKGPAHSHVSVQTPNQEYAYNIRL